MEDFIQFMNEGGWILERGSMTRHLGLFGEEKIRTSGVQSVRIDDGEIIITCEGGEVRLPNDDRNEIHMDGDPNIDHIGLNRSYGCTSNPTGFNMVFTNSGAMRLNNQHAQEQRMLRRERERKEHYDEVNSFLARQLALAGNGRVVRLASDEANLVIEFENGHRLFVCGGEWEINGLDLDVDPDQERFRTELYVAGSDTFNPKEQRPLEHEDFDIIYHD